MNTNVSFTYTSELEGISSRIVQVEMSMKKGIPRFGIVGLATGSTREASERVRIALENSHFHFPMQNLIVNLSPAGVRKESSYFDLAIAVGVLILTTQVKIALDLSKILFLGEIGLDGSIKPIKGLSNLLLSPWIRKFEQLVIPSGNKAEACLSEGIQIFPISHILEIPNILSGFTSPSEIPPWSVQQFNDSSGTWEIFQDQLLAFRALVLGVTGKHHTLLIGSPGGGKTMLAKLCIELMPTLTRKEMEEIIRIKSSTEIINESTIQNTRRPFRSPHHTSSDISIIGGGRTSKIGEVTLAHNGILFLDELGEFKPQVIQALREPLEEGQVTISRVDYHLTYPANFLLIAATNPCPCGFKGSKIYACKCSEVKIQKYHSRLSGPFLDRMDLIVRLEPFENSNRKRIPISKSEIHSKIQTARNIQMDREKFTKTLFNGSIHENDIEKICVLSESSKKILHRLYENPTYSLRRISKILKLSRTIADMEPSELIQEEHLLEAIQYFPSESILSKAI
jgi:magnesium chelatase family protein